MRLKIGIITLLTAFTAAATVTDSLPQAPIVEVIETAGRIHIEQPQALNQRLMPKAAPMQATSVAQSADEADTAEPSHETRDASQATAVRSRAGYRVQVFDDNNPRTARRDANNMKSAMESRFPQWRAYVSFNSPYWRVKVGDFPTRAEAEAAVSEIKEAFPQSARLMRVVRDKINVLEY